MRVKFDDSDYSTLSDATITFIQAYRNSVGDIATPGYDSWIEERKADESAWEKLEFNAIIFLIWGFWIAQQFIVLIVLLNFLIAVISQVYDDIISQQTTLTFKHKATLNREYFMILRYLNSLQEFNTIVFSDDKELVEQE